MDERNAKTKDPFNTDVMDDVIAQNMKARDEKRSPLREKKRRDIEKKKVAAQNRAARGKIYIVVAIVLVIVAALLSKSLIQIVNLKAEKEQAERNLAALQEHIERLNEELKRVTSDEYIEQQARQQLRMIYPGEILYIVLDK